MAQGIDQHPNNKTYFNITFKILLQIPPPPQSPTIIKVYIHFHKIVF